MRRIGTAVSGFWRFLAEPRWVPAWEEPPRTHGLAWHDVVQERGAFYPIPLNWAAWAVHLAWVVLRRGPRTLRVLPEPLRAHLERTLEREREQSAALARELRTAQRELALWERSAAGIADAIETEDPQALEHELAVLARRWKARESRLRQVDLCASSS